MTTRRRFITWSAALASLLDSGLAAARDTRESRPADADEMLRDRALRAMRLTDSTPPWFTSANWDNRAYAPWTDYLAGKLSEAEFSQVCANPSDYCLRDVWNLKRRTPVKIDWTANVPFNWAGIHALALRFFRSGDDIYLNKWLDVVVDFADWSRQASAAPGTPLSRGQAAPLLDAGAAWGGIFTALTVIAKALGGGPAASAGRLASPFASNRSELPAAELERIPAIALRTIAESFAGGMATLLARYHSMPDYVPNQRLAGLEPVACLDAFFPSAAGVAQLRATAHAGILDGVSRYRMRDGGQLEQSFNYAEGLVLAVARMAKLPYDDAPAWLGEAEKTVTGWQRMAGALATPAGGLPQVGNAAWGRFGRNLPAMNFAATSMAFPYSGYYVQRSAWADDAAYLFFFYRRAARGHTMAGCNSIQLAAFGRTLLVTGGSSDYRGANAPWKGYLDELSTHKTSTVLVDGLWQRSGSLQGVPAGPGGKPNITVAPEVPIASRWHASANFDFTEGSYVEGYQGAPNRPTTPIVTDVTHTRQVIFVRALNAWVVVDVLRTSDTHRYTQIWKLAPPGRGPAAGGFTKEQVSLRASERIVHTADGAPNAVNLSLQHFGLPTLSYGSWFAEGGYGYVGLGPLSDPLPAADVHVDWSGRGTQVLLTVLTPYRGQRTPWSNAIDTSTTSQTGCQLQAESGARLSVAAAGTPSTLSVGNLNIDRGEVLVLLERKGQPNVGLAIAGTDSNEFSARDKIAIRIPEGHRWKTGSDGRLEALYDKA